MATFWEIAAHSVDNMFSYVFLLFVILVISHFGYEDWIWVLIATVPDLGTLLSFVSHATYSGREFHWTTTRGKINTCSSLW